MYSSLSWYSLCESDPTTPSLASVREKDDYLWEHPEIVLVDDHYFQDYEPIYSVESVLAKGNLPNSRRGMYTRTRKYTRACMDSLREREAR